jgi:hypothetical protein
MSTFAESTIESAALGCLESLGWAVVHTPVCGALLPKFICRETRVKSAERLLHEGMIRNTSQNAIIGAPSA